MSMSEDFEISVAPMMDWTDRHCRYFHRLISPHVKLYTEMVTTGALLHGDRERFLRFDKAEHPVALQLGGSDPVGLSKCAVYGAQSGYDEINLNCGCPSDRVQSGSFGTCLMREPELVADCIAVMQAEVDIPVTVKSRIGIDDEDSFEFLDRFVDTIANKGCTTFIIHARKAWLKGLSPKQNREIPPLDYVRVQKVKEKYPELRIILNGGITNIDQIKDQLGVLDGVMIGREAYQNPWLLSQIEEEFFGISNLPSREDVALALIPYIEQQRRDFDTPVKSITRHIMGLFQGLPGAKAWRRALSTYPYEDGAGSEVIEKALLEKDAAAASKIMLNS